MKIFRWSGLGGFVVVTALLGVIGFFFIDGWMKKAIEAAGTQMNGAEVNVGQVDLTLNPLGFKLQQLQVADADKPSHNAVEFGQVQFDLNFPQLFLGNVRIQDLTVADVQTNTERAVAAKLVAAKPKDDAKPNAVSNAAKAKAEQLGSALPAPSSVVDDNTENTRSAVTQASDTLAESKSAVAESIKKLPDDARKRSYETRIDEIESIELDSLENIKRSQALLQSVGKDFAQDKLAINSVERTLNQAYKSSKDSVENIAQAPAEDWAQLQENYPLNKESALKVAQLLLGESFFSKIEQAQYWYGKAKPWLAKLKSDEQAETQVARAQGETIRFAHPNPTAKFQLDHALISLVAENWPWELTIDDVSTHTGALYTPVKLNLRRGDAGAEALLISGLLDQINGQSKDTFTLKGTGVEFSPQSLALAGTQLNWTPDDANVDGQIVATDGQLSGVVSIYFPSNQFDVQGQGDTAAYVAKAMAQVSAFKIDIIVSGRTQKPNIEINSDLDRQLSGAFAGIAQAEYQAWLAQVKTELNAEVAKLRKPIDDAYAKFEDEKERIEAEIAAFEDEVQAELKALEDKANAEKNRLEGLAKAELDNAKAEAAAQAERLQQEADAEAERLRLEAEAEKNKAEAAAKKAAEDKLKDEANKLKGKLKF